MILKRWVAFILLLVTVTLTGCKNPTSKEPEIVQAFAFNTFITITVYDDVPKGVTDTCLKMCNDYELIFSRTNPNSELFKLNETGHLVCSDILIEGIQTGLEYSALSKGAFDITIASVNDLWSFSSAKPVLPDPDKIKTELPKVDYRNVIVNGNEVFLKNNAKIDLGAIAKGLIADKLKEYLVSQNVHHALINLGGNILLIGGKSSSEDFSIGIQKPFANDKTPILGLKISDRSIVSTGIYERCFTLDNKFYHHILNPQTGYPYENEIAGITIISKNSITADALSTTCYCLGINDGLKLVNSLPDTYAVFIKKDGSLIYSDGFKENLTIVN